MKRQYSQHCFLNNTRIWEFRRIFQNILEVEPFKNAKEKNIDVINTINFGIFYELQGERVAQEGLRDVLK